MSHFTDLAIELFKRGDYSLITDKDGKTFEQQKLALELLADNEIEELAFGGGAGGAKSYTGWMWLSLMSLSYDETHYFVARETLKDLRMYGMQSFSEVATFLEIERDVDYKYHAQDSYIEFNNGSKIYLLECKKKPSDADFHGLGSSLFTSGFIEEAGEVHFDAYDTLCSRVNRWKNDDYNILGKIFITCNPSHNWLYTGFYKANKEDTLKDNQRFIPALAKDNPYIQRDYIRKLANLKDPNKRARLYLGEWEYDDDPSKLCDYDAICDLFTNSHVQGGEGSISADLAMQGRDKFIAGYWSGLICNVAIDIPKCTGKEIEMKLKELKTINGVGNSRIVADSDGLGAYLDSYIKNIKTFHGGSSAKNKKEFGNLKDECGFKLAELINSRSIKINCSPQQQERIKLELSICLKRDNVNIEKKKLIKKDKQKELMGGDSPDYFDMLMMEMIFHVKNKEQW